MLKQARALTKYLVFNVDETAIRISNSSKQAITPIIVPANGTSHFQPLDRRIYGILKSKLRSLAGTIIHSGSIRFEMIAKDLVTSWSGVSNDNLIFAWEIPNLGNLVRKIDKGSADEDDIDLDYLDFIEEEDNDDSDDPDYLDF